MDQPVAAGTKPIVVELEQGKQYYYCACGLSKSQPFCDGSHIATSITPLPFTAKESGKAWLCMCKQTKTAPYCDGTHKKVAVPAAQ
jgi:CDGSH-type Zn-finger protein